MAFRRYGGESRSSGKQAVVVPLGHVSVTVTREDVEEKRIKLEPFGTYRHIVSKLQQHQQEALMIINNPIPIPCIDSDTTKAYWPSLHSDGTTYYLTEFKEWLYTGVELQLWYEKGVLKFYVDI